MTMYFFHQKKHKDIWVPALATERDRIIQELNPELSTVLDVDSVFDKDTSPEDIQKAKYKGPFYFDFDGEIDEATANFQVFLVKLKDMGVNIESLRLYCSGGKGFHIEMPAETVISKPPVAGVVMLPSIMREMAHDLYVDTLDLKVYSTRKGRMWRNPNVLREDKGTYKVQITSTEAMSMTPELYASLVKAPRPLFEPEDSRFNPELAFLYSKAKDKVDASLKKKKGKKHGVEKLASFAGKWPETLQKILDGSGLSEAAGFNQIAMQLAIVANALGKEEKLFLEECDHLIHNHKGDGGRYGKPSARRSQLIEQYRYMQDNPCYSYDQNAVLALCNPETKATTDLTGAPAPEDSKDGDELPEGAVVVEEHTRLRIQRGGIYSLGQNGWAEISNVGLGNPVLLSSLDCETVLGYQIDVYVENVFVKRTLLTLDKLQSKAAFHAFCISVNSAFRGTDMDTANMIDALRRRIKDKQSRIYIIEMEGVNLILPPGSKTEEDLTMVWASPDIVVTTGDVNYTFRAKSGVDKAYNSDLESAPDLRNCDEDRELIDNLLEVNIPETVAKMLGWYSAAFMCPLFRRFYKQFPSLQAYGVAGSGKSKTTLLFNHLHYNLREPKSTMADGTTPFAMQTIASGSSSLPVVIEELREELLTSPKYKAYINILKSSYDGTATNRGGLTRDTAQRDVVVNTNHIAAPIAWTSESMEMAPAILERSICVPMMVSNQTGRDHIFEWLEDRYNHLGRIGKQLMHTTLSLNPMQFKEEFSAVRKQVKALTKERADRPLYNVAVLLMGLNLFKVTLNQTFGDEYDERIEALKSTLTDDVTVSIPKTMSEPARVLDMLAQLSFSDEINYQLIKGRDYTVDKDDGTIDIKLKPSYDRYMRYCRTTGQNPIYGSSSAFVMTMMKYEAVIKKACPENVQLFTSMFEPIYKFSVARMDADEIRPFKD
jgi:hypothetical protein